jgi:hypothetical protein
VNAPEEMDPLGSAQRFRIALGVVAKSVLSEKLIYLDCRFESRRWHGCLSLVSDVCCKEEVSAAG